MNKQEYQDEVNEAKPFIGKEFTLDELKTPTAKKKISVKYKFVSIPQQFNVTEEGKGYKALGEVENVETGIKKQVSLKIILKAFSNNS